MVALEEKPQATLNLVDATIVMSGSVTLQNVMEVYQAGKKLLSTSLEQVTVSCKAITHCDTGLLALLFAWRRDCQCLEKTLSIIDLSPTVIEMAKLYDVLPLLTEV